MNSETKILNGIKRLFGMEVKMETLKLKNGTVLEAESFEIGWDLFIVSEDGEKVPTPEGSYELEDGRVIVTDAQGVIVTIGEPEAVDQPEQEEEMEQEQTAPESKTPKKVVESVSVETHFSAEQLQELKTMFERHLVSVHDADGEKEAQAEVKEEAVKAKPKAKAKKEKMEEDVKTEMSEDVIHNPEQAEKKAFNWDKRNKIVSRRQSIITKMNKINNKN